MVISVSAPHLTSPTYESLEKYIKKKLPRIKKLLRATNQHDNELRLSAEKNHDTYVVTIELFEKVHKITKSKDRHLFKAVDSAVDQIIRQMRKDHEKRVDKSISRFRDMKSQAEISI